MIIEDTSKKWKREGNHCWNSNVCHYHTLNIAATFLMYAILLKLSWHNFNLAD